MTKGEVSLASVLDLLLARPAHGVNEPDARGRTPLHAAVLSSNTTALARLLKVPGINLEADEEQGLVLNSF